MRVCNTSSIPYVLSCIRSLGSPASHRQEVSLVSPCSVMHTPRLDLAARIRSDAGASAAKRPRRVCLMSFFLVCACSAQV